MSIGWPDVDMITELATQAPKQVCFSIFTLAPAPHLAFVSKDDGVLSTT